MIRLLIASCLALVLSGCFVLVPIPLHVSDVAGARSVPLRQAPAGSAAAAVGAVVNADRKAQGLAPLSHNALLDRVARAHAADMSQNGFFSHTGSKGTSPRERLKAAGYGPCRTAENIGDGYRTAEAAAKGWRESPPHQRNNLDPKLLEYGVGHAAEGRKWVLLLAQPGC